MCMRSRSGCPPTPSIILATWLQGASHRPSISRRPVARRARLGKGGDRVSFFLIGDFVSPADEVAVALARARDRAAHAVKACNVHVLPPLIACSQIGTMVPFCRHKSVAVVPTVHGA